MANSAKAFAFTFAVTLAAAFPTIVGVGFTGLSTGGGGAGGAVGIGNAFWDVQCPKRHWNIRLGSAAYSISIRPTLYDLQKVYTCPEEGNKNTQHFLTPKN